MFQPAKLRKGMGISVDYGDFILIRPKANYRMNASVIIVKGKQPIVIGAGVPEDPGIIRIKNTMKSFKINPNDVKYIIISHTHQDHSFNLKNLESLCKNAKVVCHQRSSRRIQNPAQLEDAWVYSLNLLGKPTIIKTMYSVFSPFVMMFFYKSPNIYPRIDYTTNVMIKAEDFSINKCPKLIAGENIFRLIPTTGHDLGHLSILDNHKNLYLEDFVPFTPWIEPQIGALDEVINSIKIILKLTNNEVARAVRAHGDFRRDPNYKGKLNDSGPWYGSTATWEVCDWSEEKERFKYWLDKIYATLQRIPELLEKRPLNTYEIAKIIIPHYKKYSKIMSLFFIPPAISWILAYCLKLEQQGKINKSFYGRYLYWSI